MTRVGRFSIVLAILGAASTASAQTVACVPAAVPTLVRGEGLTEPVGDIVLTCSGPASATVNTSLTLFVTANVTNRLAANGTVDVQLTADTGTAPLAPATLMGANSINFYNATFNLNASGKATLRISNIRVAVGQPNPPAVPVPIQAWLALAGPSSLSISSARMVLATPATGLLASFSSTGVRCSGSPLPSGEIVTFANLVAKGTTVFSARATEGFGGAFQKRTDAETNGTRIVVRYSGFPANARLFVPDALAGSDAAQPTSGGDVLAPAAGQYTFGSGALVLSLVSGADPNGAGGYPLFSAAGAGTVSFDSMHEVLLTGGAGMAVYEVMDSNPGLRESVWIPTFLGLPAITDGTTTIAQQTLSLGPVSTADTASSSAPVPRFLSATPQKDCATLGDCDSFPKLLVVAQPLNYTAAANATHQIQYVTVKNDGSGLLNWSATVAYKNGSGWLRVFPTSGTQDTTMRVDALPQGLAPGRYEATLTVDAGPFAGSRTLPVVFEVTPAVQPPAPPVQPPAPPVALPAPAIAAVTNAASFAPGPVVPGSLATVMGSGFDGKAVLVTFDGIPARLFFTGKDQINLLVPAELGARSAAQVTVTVDGVASAPFGVALSLCGPGIFSNGVLNQDYTANGPQRPAKPGTVIQIFATGLPAGEFGAITAKIHDREIAVPYYAGPAPGFPGLQQINIAIPDDLPSMTTEVIVCGTLAANPGQRVCSRPAKVILQQ